MCQNPDGTYSHADAEGEPIPPSLTEGAATESQCIQPDTLASLRETMTNYDGLPAHVHPTVPVEIMDPNFVSASPALKLWPLAVLVFYNVSGGPFG